MRKPEHPDSGRENVGESAVKSSQPTYCENCVWIRPAKMFSFWTSRRYAFEFAKCGHPNAIQPVNQRLTGQFVALPSRAFPAPVPGMDYCSIHNSEGQCPDYEEVSRARLRSQDRETTQDLPEKTGDPCC